MHKQRTDLYVVKKLGFNVVVDKFNGPDDKPCYQIYFEEPRADQRLFLLTEEMKNKALELLGMNCEVSRIILEPVLAHSVSFKEWLNSVRDILDVLGGELPKEFEKQASLQSLYISGINPEEAASIAMERMQA